MAAGKLEIINVALTRIGANTIVSEDDGTTEQKIAIAVWDTARRATLRDHAWNFAIEDVELSALSTYSPLFEFKHAYPLPANCVRLLQVYGNPNFRLQGKNILSDSSRCHIKYVKDVTDPTLWDVSFDDVMAQRLAAELAYAINKSQSSADSAWAIYDRKLKAARHIDSTEDVLDTLDGFSSSIITVRY